MSKLRKFDNAFALLTSERLPNVLTAEGHHEGRARAQNTADTLSRVNIYTARATLMQAALVQFVGLCYQSFADSTLSANVDATGRILIATPWSRKRYPMYGLRRSESDALRHEMHCRTLPEMADVPLFDYMENERAWFLNRWNKPYAHQQGALEYLDKNPITWQMAAFGHLWPTN